MPTAKISSRAAIKGHPLHPAIIHFPIAALLMLVGSDIAFVITADEFWARASFWLATVGLAGGALSSVAGAIDLFTVRRIRRLVTAWAHGLLAIMLLSLATLNLMLRLGGNPGELIIPWGLYVTLLTAALINITGALGAQLVYEYGIGVDVTQAREPRVKH
ncbi:DUF2231 domain-containing protein [Aliidiomarina sp. Khilg15.8]